MMATFLWFCGQKFYRWWPPTVFLGEICIPGEMASTRHSAFSCCHLLILIGKIDTTTSSKHSVNVFLIWIYQFNERQNIEVYYDPCGTILSLSSNIFFFWHFLHVLSSIWIRNCWMLRWCSGISHYLLCSAIQRIISISHKYFNWIVYHCYSYIPHTTLNWLFCLLLLLFEIIILMASFYSPPVSSSAFSPPTLSVSISPSLSLSLSLSLKVPFLQFSSCVIRVGNHLKVWLFSHRRKFKSLGIVDLLVLVCTFANASLHTRSLPITKHNDENANKSNLNSKHNIQFNANGWKR